MKSGTGTYGLVAEFDDPERLVDAVRRARAEGYRRMDAYAPFPVEGLAEALEFHNSRIPFVVLIGGIVGCVGGYGLQYYAMVIDYPLNVGGRPLNSWPLYVPVMFETTVLIAALSAVLGMLALNGLPMPYHPLFNVAAFDRATQDKFFLSIEAADPKFDLQATRKFLKSLEASEVHHVPH